MYISIFGLKSGQVKVVILWVLKAWGPTEWIKMQPEIRINFIKYDPEYDLTIKI